LIIIGGGHTSVSLDILLQQNVEILAVISPEKPEQPSALANYQHLRNDDDSLRYRPEDIELIKGIGFISASKKVIA